MKRGTETKPVTVFCVPVAPVSVPVCFFPVLLRFWYIRVGVKGVLLRFWLIQVGVKGVLLGWLSFQLGCYSFLFNRMGSGCNRKHFYPTGRGMLLQEGLECNRMQEYSNLGYFPKQNKGTVPLHQQSCYRWQSRLGFYIGRNWINDIIPSRTGRDFCIIIFSTLFCA